MSGGKDLDERGVNVETGACISPRLTCLMFNSHVAAVEGEYDVSIRQFNH